MNESQIILKQDRRGRVRRTVEQRAAIVEEFRRSGLSAGRFAQLSGIKYNTLWTWLKLAGIESRMRPVRGPRLVRAVVASPRVCVLPVTEALRVHVGRGVCIEMLCAAQVPLAAQLIQTLNGSAPC